MSTAGKDIIYIDIDDEITSIIEKVQTADEKIVALVLPKRAAVLQSVVNMKLLKRSADEAKKHVVLITSEVGLLPLAGAVGLHVAKTLQTKPAVPAAPKIADRTIDIDEPDEVKPDDAPLDKSKSIGVLAGLRSKRDDEEETIEVDNTDDKTPDELAEPVKKPANKKLKVPNFGKFRNRLFLGGGALILLIILWYVAAFALPKAHIVIKTDTSSETTNFSFATDPGLEEVNLTENIVPSIKEELKKADTEKVTATGEKDNGTKAAGTVTIRNCDYSDGFTISSGASFAGANGKNYVSTKSVTVPKFTGSASSCNLSGSSAGKATVEVQAQSAGESFNVGTQTYNVPGIPNNAEVDAVGSAMTGGTTKIVKVLSQKDFDDAKKRVEERTATDVDRELREILEDKGYFALGESVIVSTPEITSTPKVGEEASEATLTSNITYTMVGVMEDDLKELIRENLKDVVDDDREMIQSTGLDEAAVRITDKQPDGKVSGSLQTIAVIGPKLDINELKQLVAGKKKSQTQELLLERPGIKDVEVSYHPFWVFSTPGKTGKITITLEQASPTDTSDE